MKVYVLSGSYDFTYYKVGSQILWMHQVDSDEISSDWGGGDLLLAIL